MNNMTTVVEYHFRVYTIRYPFSKKTLLTLLDYRVNQFWAYGGQSHNNIGWAMPMPFASINPTNPRTNLWNFHEKILRIGGAGKWGFFEAAILNFLSRPFWIFFCFITVKNPALLYDVSFFSALWMVFGKEAVRTFMHTTVLSGLFELGVPRYLQVLIILWPPHLLLPRPLGLSNLLTALFIMVIGVVKFSRGVQN